MTGLRIPEPLRTLARAARKAGWLLTCTGSGHIRWRAPDGTVVVTSSTPGCKASIRATRSQLRKAGLKEEGR